MTVRDAAIADVVPSMSDFEGVAFVDGRLPYNLGHAAFEFIESRWGKEGIRQFLFALRKNVIGGGESAYEEAFRLKAEEFDEQFDKYLKDRFKPFRDKERPADYGRDLAPKREKTPYVSVVSIEPSPSGDLLAVAAGNRKEQELDIILLSTKDSKVIRNLTSGFNKDRGYEYIATPGGFRNNAVPWMSWSPTGDRIAYFARTEKMKTLILQNAVNGKVEQRIEIKTVDMPESPDFSPDGKQVAFSGLVGATGDIFIVDLESKNIKNVTNDSFGDFAPTWSPDGKSLVYLARASGNDKLFILDLASGKKTQLTFGTHDDGGAQFVDEDTLVFPSTAIDPNQPVEAEVARNGNIYNIWTLNLKTKELRQFTDTLTGNTSPVVLRDTKPARIGFVTYYKGEYGIHVLSREEPLHTVASSDFGDATLGPPIPFQPPMTHEIVPANKRKKGAFEKLFLEGRPPVALGVTSGGDLFGGTQVTFTDVLGDKQFNIFAASVSQYRTLSASYINLSRRLQYAIQGYSQTQFFYAYDPYAFYGVDYGYIDRDQAIATQTARGGTISAIYPLNRYTRLEMSGGFLQFKQEYNEPGLQDIANDYQAGAVRPLLVRRRAVRAARHQPGSRDDDLPRVRPARRTHDVAGLRVRAELGQPAVASDLRRRRTLLPAAGHERRARVARTRLQELGRVSRLPVLRRQLGDARLRLPAVHRQQGLLHRCRAAVPDHRSGADADWRGRRATWRVLLQLRRRRIRGHRTNVWTTATTLETPLVDYAFDPTSPSQFVPVYGPPRVVSVSASSTAGRRTVSGSKRLRLVSRSTSTGRGGRSSTGTGRTWCSPIRRASTAYTGPNAGSTWFRKVKFSVWIGYDF